MAKGYKMGQSGGGINKTLPYQLTAFTAVANHNTPSITLSWQNPTEYWAGTLIVKRAGSMPEGVNDGEKIYNGTGTTYTDMAVEHDTEYFYRAFPYNAKKQYQTEVLTVSAMAKTGIALSELPEGALVNIVEDGTEVNFYLAKHDYESALNGAGRQLMVRKALTDNMKWAASGNNYNGSIVDVWFNNDYKAKFSAVVQNMMSETAFYCANDSKVVTLLRGIFTASLSEYGVSDGWFHVEGSKLPISDVLKIGYYNGVAKEYSTRSACEFSTVSSYNSERVGVMNADGSHTSGFSCPNTTAFYYYTRPCFTLPADALVDPTPNADGSYKLIES